MDISSTDKPMVILGAMTGSSLDGLDLALVEFSRGEYRILAAKTIAYPDQWVEKLRTTPQLTGVELLRTEASFSVLLAEMINDFLTGETMLPTAIAIHGHTVFHEPQNGFSYQMVNASSIASLTKIDTISDFRNQDIALGGQGTPLAAKIDQLLFSNYLYCLNLGGIANITIQSSGTAYDICPCNQLLNHWARKLGHNFDSNGDLAKQGSWLTWYAEHLDADDYYHKKPPKSIDNNWIVKRYLSEEIKALPMDLLHTTTRWIAEKIADQLEEPGKLLITGGGAKNHYLVGQIKEKTKEKGIIVELPSAEVIEYKEAILMALLGKLFLEKKSNVVSSATGAEKNTVSGAFYYGN